MRKNTLIICTFLVMLLFVYAASSKLFNIAGFRHDMLSQPFPRQISLLFVWAVPAIEILLVILLFFFRARIYGLLLAVCLLFAFSLYTFLILNHMFSKLPCSCGGIISNLSWTQHLYLNLFFLLLACTGFVLQLLEILDTKFHAHETGLTENLKKSRYY